MAKQVMPMAELEPRPNDIALPDEWLLKLSLFTGLKQTPSIDKFPGALVVRHYVPGEVVYRQGEGGGTAFYILNAQDRHVLRGGPRARLDSLPALIQSKQDSAAVAERARLDLEKRLTEQSQAPDAAAWRKQLDAVKKELAKLAKELPGLENELEALPDVVATLERSVAPNAVPARREPGLGTAAAESAPTEVAIVHLAYAVTGSPPPSWWSRFKRALSGSGSDTAAPQAHQPSTRQATFQEGDWFGEMSCLNRTPRAGTVIVTRECFMVELMRNIFDALQKDPEFRRRTAELYRERTLRSQLRALPLFSTLDDAHLERLRTEAELIDFEPGMLICDEHERSDSMYVIRSGIVKVMKNASFLLGPEDVADAGALQDELARVGGALAAVLPDTVGTVATLNELIKLPTFHQRPEFGPYLGEKQIPRRVWQFLADPSAAAPAGMQSSNRVLLEGISGGQLLEWNPADGERGGVLRAEHIRSWKELFDNLFVRDKPTDKEGPARMRLRKLMSAAFGEVKPGQEPPPAVRDTVVHGLNELLRLQPWLLWQEFSDLALSDENLAERMMLFLPRQRQWSDYDFQRGNRACNRFLLEALLPRSLRHSQVGAGPPFIISYSSRGESLGEMGAMENSPRSATCVTYNHPDDDPKRKVGPVQMVRISRQLFEELKSASGPFRQAVTIAVAAHKARDVQRAAAPLAQRSGALLDTGRALELGIIQGQKLMLIDLDRCTRCDECVQACVNTHDDRRSRLFLDGPRFGKYLVPTTCRSCLDPVCMIGCPVSSIRRGDNREMVIESWCIGCGKCAEQCPYEAIQMHDIGIVPERSLGWRVLVAPKPPHGWEQPGYGDRRWAVGSGPFRADRTWRELGGNPPVDGMVALFRYGFHMDGDLLKKDGHFRLTLTSSDPAAGLWLNGQELKTDEAKRGTQEFTLAQKSGAAPPLRTGHNLLAVRVIPGAAGETVMGLRVDKVEKPRVQFALPDEVTQKPVTERAVVCDLCSTLSAGPACVRACPHDAAMRINARFEFPTR